MKKSDKTSKPSEKKWQKVTNKWKKKRHKKDKLVKKCYKKWQTGKKSHKLVKVTY